MSKSKFIIDKLAKLFEQGLISYKDLSSEILNILRSQRDDIIFKMKLTSKEETEVLIKRIEKIEKKIGKLENINLKKKIKKAIKIDASPRHVPSKIISILEIPKTKNGKLVELAVKQSIEGDRIKNLEALANPDSLKQFKNIKELYE